MEHSSKERKGGVIEISRRKAGFFNTRDQFFVFVS